MTLDITAGPNHTLALIHDRPPITAQNRQHHGRETPHSVSAPRSYAVFGAHAEDATALWNAAVESLTHTKQIPGVSTEQRLSA